MTMAGRGLKIHVMCQELGLVRTVARQLRAVFLVVLLGSSCDLLGGKQTHIELVQ